MYHYRNVSFWREAPALVASFVSPHQWWLNGYLDSLTCRALILLIKLDATRLSAMTTIPRSDARPVSFTLSAVAELEMDTMLCCSRLINPKYDEFESRGKPEDASFISAYELFNACIAYVYLDRSRTWSSDTRHRGASSTFSPSTSSGPDIDDRRAPGRSTDAAGVVVQKCSTLITILSMQFTSLRVLQRALLALAARLSGAVCQALHTSRDRDSLTWNRTLRSRSRISRPCCLRTYLR